MSDKMKLILKATSIWVLVMTALVGLFWLYAIYPDTIGTIVGGTFMFLIIIVLPIMWIYDNLVG